MVHGDMLWSGLLVHASDGVVLRLSSAWVRLPFVIFGSLQFLNLPAAKVAAGPSLPVTARVSVPQPLGARQSGLSGLRTTSCD